MDADTDLCPDMPKELVVVVVELTKRPGELAGDAISDCVASLDESLQPFAMGLGAVTGGGWGDIVTTASLLDMVTDIFVWEEVFSLATVLPSSGEVLT